MTIKRDVSEMRLRVFKQAEKIGNTRATCQYFEIPRSSFYNWKGRYDIEGESGLVDRPRDARNHSNHIPVEIIDRVLRLRRKHHLGPIRIVWYMTRYHDIKI